MKSVKLSSSTQTLAHLHLSYMDFLDDPAAIQWSRLIICCATQDERPNELTNPEILTINHTKYIHSFGLILPAIFPDRDISSCACIVLLFETSSSSHVESIIARQRGALSSDTVIWPCLTASKREICHNYHHARDPGLIQSFSYGFSGWPRCNPMKQTDNILCHTRREPKRI